MSADEMQSRVKTLEESFQLLVQLIHNHDTRFDALTETMNDLAERITILTDAQIKTEERVQQLAESYQKLSESQQRLAESQQKLAESQQKLSESQRELTESQRHTDERLNALIDIVMQQRRDGGGEPLA